MGTGGLRERKLFYYQLKRETKKFLQEFAGAEDVIRTKKQAFLIRAECFGIDLTIAEDDFEEMKRLME